MTFSYMCVKCGKGFDGDWTIGKAPKTVPCPACGGTGKRVYSGVSIAVKVSGSRPSGFGEQMKRRNDEAGRRMKARKPPVRLAALDYGDGNVKEVRAK